MPRRRWELALTPSTHSVTNHGKASYHHHSAMLGAAPVATACMPRPTSVPLCVHSCITLMLWLHGSLYPARCVYHVPQPICQRVRLFVHPTRQVVHDHGICAVIVPGTRFASCVVASNHNTTNSLSDFDEPSASGFRRHAALFARVTAALARLLISSLQSIRIDDWFCKKFSVTSRPVRTCIS